MNQDTELFPDPAEVAAKRTEPRLWVKELAVYKEFKPGEEMRRITLRPGLNIIWAKDSESGASGHAAGKSTFCRMLRYLLGDVAYGTEVFRSAFREKFPDAYLIGEVHLDGTPWLIVRPLGKSGHHWCARDTTWEALFEDGIKHPDYKVFTDELEKTFISPLGIETFPGTQRKIEWVHFLQWLTRDQDARFAHLLEWRPPASDGAESKYLTSSDKTNLIRMVLRLLEPKELEQQNSHAELLSDQNELESEIPNLLYSRNRVIADLKAKKLIPDIGKSDISMSLAGLAKELGDEIDHLDKQFQEANRQDGVGEVFAANLTQTTQRKTELEASHKANADHVKLTRSRFRHEKGEITKEELLAQSAELGDIKGKCSNSIHMAHAFKCPIAPMLERDELQEARIVTAKSATEYFENQLKLDEAALAVLKRQLDEQSKRETQIKEKVTELKTAHFAKRAKLHEDLTAKRGLLATINRAIKDDDDAESKREALKLIKRDVSASTKDLAAMRKEASKRLTELSAQFNEVASFLLKRKVDGRVRFNSDEVIPELNYQGDMSSAALVTLRLLIFDLACLSGSTGLFIQHPGFLLHDSPREADLSATIYRRMFSLIAGEQENQAVQYIIATTEAPPENLQQTPWLVCEPLSSETPETRFLKSII